MKQTLKKIARHKMFVPIVILILILIAFSSFLEDKKGSNTVSLNVERQLEEICNSIEGVNNAKVMITYENALETSFFENKNPSKILGIAIVCEGGGDPKTQLKLYEMIKALFGIPATRITVSERNTYPPS